MRLGQEVQHLLLETVTNTAGAARRIIGFRLPMQVGWVGLALTAVLAQILVYVLQLIAAKPLEGPIALYRDPVVGLSLQMFAMVIVALIMAGAGLPFHKQFRFRSALFLAVWLQFAMLCATTLQILLMLVVPLVGMILALVIVIGFVWMLGVFTFVLNEPVHPGLLTLGLILTFVVAVLALSIVFGLLGIDPQLIQQGAPDV